MINFITTINFDLEVDKNMNLVEAHKLSYNIEQELYKEFGNNLEIYIHLDPVGINIKKCVELKESEIKKIEQIIVEVKNKFKFAQQIHDLNIKKSDGKYVISLHCVFSNNISVERAHNYSNHIQRYINSNLDNVEHVFVHVEPKEWIEKHNH